MQQIIFDWWRYAEDKVIFSKRSPSRGNMRSENLILTKPPSGTWPGTSRTEQSIVESDPELELLGEQVLTSI